jgi:hypothetical protein
MTFEPAPGYPVRISEQAQRVMQQAAAKRKPTTRTTRGKAKPALTFDEQVHRKIVRDHLLSGYNPLLSDPEVVEELCKADPAVKRAVDAWFDSRRYR